MTAAPELIPEGITLSEALASLMVLCLCVFALGCIKAVDAFVRALFGTISGAVGWIPLAGKVVKFPILAIEQKVVSALAAAERRVDGYIAHSWHQLGRLVRMLRRELEGLAWDLALVGAGLVELWKPKTILHVIGALLHPLRTAQQILHALERADRAAIARLRHMVVQGVWPRLRGVEHELERVVEHDIASLRAKTRAEERAIARVWRWIHAHPNVLAAGVASAVVAIGLRRLGLGWVRCRNVRRVGKALCGLPVSLLEDLLGLALAFGVLIDPEETAKLAVDAVDFVEPFVARMLGATAAMERDAEAALAGLLN